MKFRTNLFDLWVFCKEADITKYLLFHTSKEKADKHFSGGRFWQIPGEFTGEDEDVGDAIKRCLGDLNLAPKNVWMVEHTYTIYNPRRKSIELIPVFAAETDFSEDIPLTWEHSEFGWFTAEEALLRVKFRGLIEGLRWTREYVTDRDEPLLELKLNLS